MRRGTPRAHMTSASASSDHETVAVSPVISTQFSPSSAPKRAVQSCKRSCTIACAQEASAVRLPALGRGTHPHGRHVHHFLRAGAVHEAARGVQLARQEAAHGQLKDDGFAAPGGRRNGERMVGTGCRIKHLGLHAVEVAGKGAQAGQPAEQALLRFRPPWPTHRKSNRPRKGGGSSAVVRGASRALLCARTGGANGGRTDDAGVNAGAAELNGCCGGSPPSGTPAPCWRLRRAQPPRQHATRRSARRANSARTTSSRSERQLSAVQPAQARAPRLSTQVLRRGAAHSGARRHNLGEGACKVNAGSASKAPVSRRGAASAGAARAA